MSFCLYIRSTDHLLWIFYLSHSNEGSKSNTAKLCTELPDRATDGWKALYKQVHRLHKKKQTPTNKSLKHSIWYENRIWSMKKHTSNWGWSLKLYCNEDAKDFTLLHLCTEYIEQGWFRSCICTMVSSFDHI